MSAPRTPHRLRRPAAWLPALLLLTAAATAWLVVDLDAAPGPTRVVREAAPPSEPRPVLVVAPPVDVGPALAAARDPALGLEGRLERLDELVRRSPDAAPLLALLDGLAADDPARLPLRGAAITALGAFPEDPAARARLRWLLAPGAPRPDRLAALATIGAMPGPVTWADVAALASDSDVVVRERARSVAAR